MRRGAAPGVGWNGTSTFGSSARDGADARAASSSRARRSAAALSVPAFTNCEARGSIWRGATSLGCMERTRGPLEAEVYSWSSVASSSSASSTSE